MAHDPSMSDDAFISLMRRIRNGAPAQPKSEEWQAAEMRLHALRMSFWNFVMGVLDQDRSGDPTSFAWFPHRFSSLPETRVTWKALSLLEGHRVHTDDEGLWRVPDPEHGGQASLSERVRVADCAMPGCIAVTRKEDPHHVWSGAMMDVRALADLYARPSTLWSRVLMLHRHPSVYFPGLKAFVSEVSMHEDFTGPYCEQLGAGGGLPPWKISPWKAYDQAFVEMKVNREDLVDAFVAKTDETQRAKWLEMMPLALSWWVEVV